MITNKNIFTIWEVSNDIIVLVSSSGQEIAPETLVPPPYGITTMLNLLARRTRFSTAEWQSENSNIN